jgi:hypothetical protein
MTSIETARIYHNGGKINTKENINKASKKSHKQPKINFVVSVFNNSEIVRLINQGIGTCVLSIKIIRQSLRS